MQDFRDTITIDAGTNCTYSIYFVSLEKLGQLLATKLLRPGRCVVITDTNVAPLWLDHLTDALEGWDPFAVVLPAGEETKSAEALQSIYNKVLPLGIDRRTPIIALGGGVVGDLAGYAAATLLRGLPLVHVPTSLIAQVDSAIGGKTGINHSVGKNLIGAFYPPCLVCADSAVLRTLPELEWASGLAEVVKHALIADVRFVDFLEKSWHNVQAREPETVRKMIAWAAKIKATVVSEDALEHGRRAILNFGHTFGHAIERVAGYGSFTHGEAVALGMRAALVLSHRLNGRFYAERAMALVQRIPVRRTLTSLGIPIEHLIDTMRFDKKADRGVIRLILLHAAGEAYVTDTVSYEEVYEAWHTLYSDSSGTRSGVH